MRVAYDLHMHSCLSPCGQEDMTPANLAAMCALAGLEVVALTDHNTSGNCAAFVKAAQRHGLVALAGMELCTREEIHVICLFETPEAAQQLDEYVYQRLLPMPNRPELFGHQIRMDDKDGILGEEIAFLAGPADIGIEEVVPLVASMGGVAFPAHIDRESFSLLSILGTWDSTLGFWIGEYAQKSPEELYELYPELQNATLIGDSDAHGLDQIPDPRFFMDITKREPKAALDWLLCLK